MEKAIIRVYSYHHELDDKDLFNWFISQNLSYN